ncbi:uncharacterized protein TNCV_2351331 [Trichonephila clavipes]|nr:uncharacterized protein TNCV_2351331 [Trichonephila clavipes]
MTSILVFGTRKLYQGKNPDFCSVFRSELVAILEGLNSIESLPQPNDTWIFSDSRNAIQRLANWHNWIPSHVDIVGNEIADSLTRAGASETTTPAAPLTYLELFSKYKEKNKAIWMVPSVHPWYQKTKTVNIELDIALTDDKPIFHKPRRLPFAERDIVDAQVDEWVKNGIVEPCSSPYASQVVVVKKKTGNPEFALIIDA